jgi:hypothetical protein
MSLFLSRRIVASAAAALLLFACTGIASPADAATRKAAVCNQLSKAKAVQLLGPGTVGHGSRSIRPNFDFTICEWTRPGDVPYSTTGAGRHLFDYLSYTVVRLGTASQARHVFAIGAVQRMDCIATSDHAIAGYGAQTSVCLHPAGKTEVDGVVVDDPDYPEYYSEMVIVLKGTSVVTVSQLTSTNEAAVISQAAAKFIIRGIPG